MYFKFETDGETCDLDARGCTALQLANASLNCCHSIFDNLKKRNKFHAMEFVRVLFAGIEAMVDGENHDD